MRTREARNDMQTGAARVTSQSQQQAALPLSVLVDRWVADQIITPEQAARMTGTDEFRGYADVNEHPARVQRSSLVVVEALGYLGGAIVVAASMIIAARYWSDLASAWRLTVVGSSALTLLVSGAAAPARLADVGDRLRAVLWLASTAACAGFLAVLAVDFLDLDANDITLLVATGTAAYAVGLWLSSPTLVQQLAMMVALAVAASVVIAQVDVSDDLPGLGTWAVGLIWALLGWGGVLKPARFGLTLGSALAILGAMLTAASDAGTVFTLVTVIAVVGAAMAFRDLLLLAVGTLGLLMNLPMAITRWFPDSLAAPYALLVVGALLVVVAVWVARRRTPEATTVPRRDYSSGRAGTAVAASGVVTAIVVTAVVAIALL